MTEEPTRIRAPELVGGYWVNSDPLRLADLKGRLALIDFWDYTCVNCIHTLPYVSEWHRRYSPHGLVVVGVHAPEFTFAKELAGVQQAIQGFGIEYPVVMDNDFAIWRAYSNRYWPAKYLVDGEGYIRFYHFGEGGYQETERAIQQLILESKPDASLPELMPPLRDSDALGAVCYRVSPELYLGYQRGRVGNPAGYVPKRAATYNDPGKHAEGYFYLEGEWLADEEYIMKPWGNEGKSSVTIKYTAKEVNLVMSTLLGRSCEVDITQDGTPLGEADAGEDVRCASDGRSFLEVDGPRMYRLVNNRELGTHELTLSTETPGLALYAYTFVSCVVQT